MTDSNAPTPPDPTSRPETNAPTAPVDPALSVGNTPVSSETVGGAPSTSEPSHDDDNNAAEQVSGGIALDMSPLPQVQQSSAPPPQAMQQGAPKAPHAPSALDAQNHAESMRENAKGLAQAIKEQHLQSLGGPQQVEGLVGAGSGQAAHQPPPLDQEGTLKAAKALSEVDSEMVALANALEAMQTNSEVRKTIMMLEIIKTAKEMIKSEAEIAVAAALHKSDPT